MKQTRIVLRLLRYLTCVLCAQIGTTINGRFEAEFSVQSSSSMGLAVTTTAAGVDIAAVSNSSGNTITLYEYPTGAVIRSLNLSTVAGDPETPSFTPHKLCFAPNGTLMVVENSKTRRLLDSGSMAPISRVHELTLTFEHVRCIGEDTLCYPRGDCRGIACNTELVAVGGDCVDDYNTSDQIFLFSFSSGALIRSFGPHSERLGGIKGCYGIRFTPDGTRLAIAERSNNRVSVFTLKGVFVDAVTGPGGDWEDGTETKFKYCRDVDFATNGDMIVADTANNRICVFSPDGKVLLRCFGARGIDPGTFSYPISLAMHNGKLVVLDNSSKRVQVFS